jgi:UDP-N-acetylmuramoylalanine--D-glutamate ligase
MMRILGKGITAQAIKEKYPDAIMYDDNDGDIFDANSDDTTVVSPGIPPHNKLVQSTKNLMSEYDLFDELMPYSIWISGTNGKTTTTSMMQHILSYKGSVCGGNIGTPLAKLDEKAPIWILETSSFTLHYTNIAKPNIYVLLPISDDHVSWHGTFEEYEQSKLKPLDNLLEGEIAIVPSKYKDYPTDGYKICYDSSEDLAKHFDMDVEKINFEEPFLLDAILAMSVDKILFDTIDYEKINSFQRAEHTLEEFRDKKGRLWVNDSKGTNVDATLQALNAYSDKKIYIILGGDDKGADINPLFKQLSKLDVEVFAIGTNQNKIINLCDIHNILVNKSIDMKDAIEKISSKFQEEENGVGLLSPAASSLDQFPSYKKRGEIFKKIVLEDIV